MRYYSSTAGGMTLTATAGAADTTITVNTVVGLPASFPYTVVLEPGIAGQEEIVTVTAAAGTNLTVVRGADGTTGVTHALGAGVRHMMTARDLRESREHEAATAGVHGVAGQLVGTTATQTMDNKTFQADTDHTPLVARAAASQTTPTFAVKDSTGTNQWWGTSGQWQSDAIALQTLGAASLFGMVAHVKPPSGKDGVVVNHATGSSGYAYRAQKAGVDKFTVDLNGNVTSPTITAITGAATALDGRVGTAEANIATNTTNITTVTAAAAANTAARTAVEGAWTAWTPVITATTTNPTLSSSLGRFKVVGKTGHFQAACTVATPGSGFYTLSLPFTAGGVGFDQSVLAGLFDLSGGVHYTGRGLINSGGATVIRVHLEGHTGSLTHTNPVAVAAGDIVYYSGTIELS